MFDNCSYHKLESLVPPTPEEDVLIRDSLSRLEHLSACVIVKDGNDNILSNIPHNLHNILWKAYILEKYYTSDYTFDGEDLDDDDDEDDDDSDDENEDYEYGPKFDELPLLLYNWPHKEFILKKLMPRLTSRLEPFTSVCRSRDTLSIGPYSENSQNLETFYCNLIYAIIDSFSKTHSNSFSEQKKNDCKLRILDVTGYCFYPNDIIKNIERKDLIRKNKHGKLNIIVDASMYIYGEHISSSYHKALNSALIKPNHVSVNTSFGANKAVKSLIKKLVKNGPISINLRGEQDGSEFDALEEIYDSNTWRSNVVSVKAMWCVSSMNFLLYLDNLVHLNLKYNDMHGQLGSLSNLSKGLLYLNMCYCKLTNADLKYLSGSHHMLTLRELNLSANDFSHDEDSDHLIELYQNLSKLMKLDIYDCKLESWPNDKMSSLFNSMKKMPNILDITLFKNTFSSENIHVHVMELKESLTLRYLILSFPPQVAKWDRNVFEEGVYQKINKSRSQLLDVEFVST